MEIQHASPIILRRRLRTALRSLRDERRLSQKDVAAALDWTPSKLHRLENGPTGITVIDLRALLTFYGLTDTGQQHDLIQLARYARRQWYGEYSDILSTPLLTYLQYEGAASTIRSFEPVLVPGLLQTEEYTAALMRLQPVPSDTDEVLARRVHARIDRQRTLTRDDGPKAYFLLDEAVLYRHIGGREGMARQLRKLLSAGELSNVEIRVIPFQHGEHLGLWGSLMILEFAAPEDEDIAFIEYQMGDSIIDGGSAAVAPYLEKFWAIEAASASLEESLALIERSLRAVS